MNEKSNPMPMMYKTIPAVAELNKVPGFDPLKFLRHKVSRKTNEEMADHPRRNGRNMTGRRRTLSRRPSFCRSGSG